MQAGDEVCRRARHQMIKTLRAASCSAMTLVMALALGGCPRPSGGGAVPSYPDGAAGLEALFSDVLEAARRDDRGRVHDLFASTLMNQSDLEALFGAERARELGPHYQALMGTLINRGAVELVAQIYERKYDAVEVLKVVSASGRLSPADAAVLAALKLPLAVYSVRLKRHTEDRGLRYDFFFYRRGRWLTGNQLGRFLEPTKPEPPWAPPARPPMPKRAGSN
jgi:hypothetical protein